MTLCEILEGLADPPFQSPKVSPRLHDRIAAAARWAAERFPGDFVEIGAFKGAGTERLAEVAEECGRRVLVVDPWDTKLPDCYGGEYKAFKRRTARFDCIDVVRLPSQHPDAIAALKERELCFAFIDGLHKYDAVISDIDACFPCPVMCCDDVAWNGGVAQAFRDAAKRYALREIRVRGREAYLVKTGKIPMVPLHLDELVERLENKDPFALVRYGDGEWLAVLGRTPKPRWGVNEHKPDLPGLPDAIQGTLKNHPTEDVYLCWVAMDITERMGLNDDVEAWLAANAPHTQWCYEDPFLKAAQAGELYPFIETLRGLRTALVGGAHLDSAADLIGAEHIVIPSKNCWLAYDEIYDAVMQRAAGLDAVTFSAAMTSEVLIPALWEALEGKVSLIDVGSLWDPFCGRKSRTWHKSVSVHENLEEDMEDYPRTIVVLTVPRAGSSTVAGVLHRLGVPMTPKLTADASDPRGRYEDPRFHKLNQAVGGYHYDVRQPAGLAVRHRMAYEKLVRGLNEKAIWGFRDPRTCCVLPHIQDLFPHPYAVLVKRERDANIDALVRHSHRAYNGRLKMDREQAEAKLDEWQRVADWALENFDGPVHEVRYEDLLEDTEATVRALATFVYDGLVIGAGEQRIESACKFVDPECELTGPKAKGKAEVKTEVKAKGKAKVETEVDAEVQLGDDPDASDSEGTDGTDSSAEREDGGDGVPDADPV